MAKLPDFIPISPMTLTCPRCSAKPRQACVMCKGQFEAIHVERVEAAALKDVAAKKERLRVAS